LGLEVGFVQRRRRVFGLEALRLRPEQIAVGLVIPHLEAEIGVHERVRLVHVTNHALTGRNGAGQAMADRVTGLVLWNGGVVAVVRAHVAVLGVRAAADRIAVVGVHHVARRAAAGAEVAGIVVGAEERQRRIVQARLV
jgi:hypothetical protein